MEKVDLRFTTRDGGSRVSMTILTGGEEKIRTQWSVEDIESLIRVLGSLRSAMCVEVSKERSASSPVKSVAEPKSNVTKGDNDGHVVLSLRHPGFGWIDWDFSKIALADLLAGMIVALKS